MTYDSLVQNQFEEDMHNYNKAPQSPKSLVPVLVPYQEHSCKSITTCFKKISSIIMKYMGEIFQLILESTMESEFQSLTRNNLLLLGQVNSAMLSFIIIIIISLQKYVETLALFFILTYFNSYHSIVQNCAGNDNYQVILLFEY